MLALALASNPKFPLGQVVATSGVYGMASDNEKFGEFVSKSFNKHANGDWGNLCKEDKATNESALVNGERLFSKYHFDKDTSIYIITEWDRSVTTILFPEEY